MVRRYPIDSKGKLEVPTGSLLTVVVGWVTQWSPTDSRGRLEVHTGTLTVEVSKRYHLVPYSQMGYVKGIF